MLRCYRRTDSITVCAFTTDRTEAPLIRLVVEPDTTNGLVSRSSLMDIQNARQIIYRTRCDRSSERSTIDLQNA